LAEAESEVNGLSLSERELRREDCLEGSGGRVGNGRDEGPGGGGMEDDDEVVDADADRARLGFLGGLVADELPAGCQAECEGPSGLACDLSEIGGRVPVVGELSWHGSSFVLLPVFLVPAERSDFERLGFKLSLPLSLLFFLERPSLELEEKFKRVIEAGGRQVICCGGYWAPLAGGLQSESAI
jgi:hypothetical protein